LSGHDPVYDANIVEVPGFDDAQALYPHFRGGRSGSGWRVLKVLEDNIARRDIEVRCAFMAERLIATGDREVLGVCFRDQNGRVNAVKARRGVILACGGFESNAEMKAQYWEKAPVLPVATTANTGDGIRMAQDIGAALWHMWHHHGAYGFRYPDANIPCRCVSSEIISIAGDGRSASPGSIRTRSYFAQAQHAESQTRHEIEIPSSRSEPW